MMLIETLIVLFSRPELFVCLHTCNFCTLYNTVDSDQFTLFHYCCAHVALACASHWSLGDSYSSQPWLLKVRKSV
eukprot:737354-Amphidinium_carterae.1